MAEPVDGWLEREGVRLHYVEWRPAAETNQGAPPVLLLHGLSSNSRFWDRVARRLSDRRVIALDQRGHGLTGRPPGAPDPATGFAMDQLLEDVAFLIRELDLEQPVLAGHSWGATVALEFVGASPDLVSALVFIDGPVQSAANLFSWEDAQALMQPPLPRFRSLHDAEAESRSDFGGAWAADLEAFVKARVMPDGDDLILTLTGPARLALLRGLYDSQPDVLWSRISVPTVVLLARDASANVSGWKEQGANLLARSAPAVTIKWLDTGHDIPLYAPDDVAAEIVAISALASSQPAAG